MRESLGRDHRTEPMKKSRFTESQILGGNGFRRGSGIEDRADVGAEVVGEVQLEVNALVARHPEAGEGGQLFGFEELLQGVELELGGVALADADAAGLDLEPLDGDAFDELGHGGERR